ncbi:MAG: ABC transporter substrate-binding protein, partial [Chloroflexi bacterium]|nr:ABC transporter substrate-binding protein [Chloroflexota bacterium]
LPRRAVLRRGLAGVAGLTGAALIGCGDSGGQTPTPVGTAASGTPTAVTGTRTPRRGGTLRISGQLTGDVPSLDYDRSNSSALGSITNLTGVKLTQWDERPDSPGPVENVIPDLAESWESPDQGLTWTFKLRAGVQTSDGLEVTAEDVVWSLNRQSNGIRSPQGLVQANMPDMYTRRADGRADVNATAIDRRTVQFKLAKPDADFLAIMGSHWWTVEHRDVITKKGAAPGKTASGWGDVSGVDQIRGGGPYYPTEYVPASGFKLKRNPNYYDASLGYLDGIDHPFILDPSAAAAALQAGQLDAFGPLTQFTVNQGLELQRSPNLQVDWQPCMVWNPWIFDLRAPPFNDVRVRRALALAIDRESWIKNLLLGRGRNGSMVLPWLTYWAVDPAKMREDGRYFTTYNPAEAKQLLAAAGHEKFKFTLQTSNIGAYTVTYPFADLMTSMLAAVGISQDTRIVDYAAHIGGKTFPERGVYQSFIVRPDIQSYAYAQVGMGGGLVGGADVYGALAQADPEYVAFREIAEKQRLTQDRNARRELVADMQKRWARNVWNYYWPAPDSPVVSNKKVHNFRPPPGWNWNIMKHVWKEM